MNECVCVGVYNNDILYNVVLYYLYNISMYRCGLWETRIWKLNIFYNNSVRENNRKELPCTTHKHTTTYQRTNTNTIERSWSQTTQQLPTTYPATYQRANTNTTKRNRDGANLTDHKANTYLIYILLEKRRSKLRHTHRIE